ncbi:response regulator transcription factor [Parasphingorhabdus sp. DH2-15]|uniref:response regulator transcription factor n=1 Tax=Parasphingorhabdus sp. DH2-15 TaxID=3444112 RepID=UPI003F68829F
MALQNAADRHDDGETDLLNQIAERLRKRFEGRSALIVEDEIGEDIQNAMSESGFANVQHVRTIAGAMDLLVREPFDVIVLDRGLPDGDGIAIVKVLRSGGARVRSAANTPCLVYSMLDRTHDKVTGLLDGASDYLAKSGGEAELLARLAACLPRNDAHSGASEMETDVFSIFPIEVDEAAMVVSLNGDLLPLTTLEAAVFVEIWRAAGQPVSKTALWERCWMDHAGWTHFSPRWENCMEKAISRLRLKIRTHCTFLPASHLPLIVTWRATGFAMRNLAGLADANISATG